jgi:hypothetical protein
MVSWQKSQRREINRPVANKQKNDSNKNDALILENKGLWYFSIFTMMHLDMNEFNAIRQNLDSAIFSGMNLIFSCPGIAASWLHGLTSFLAGTKVRVRTAQE